MLYEVITLLNISARERADICLRTFGKDIELLYQLPAFFADDLPVKAAPAAVSGLEVAVDYQIFFNRGNLGNTVFHPVFRNMGHS